MTGRMQKLSRTMGAVGALYIVLAGLVLWQAAPYGVSGLVLDRALAVQSGSQIPATSVRVGDRVVAVNGQRVTTMREMAAVLARSPQDRAEAVVTIEERGRLRTATMSRLRWDHDAPEDLLSAARIVRVDDQVLRGDMPPSELAAFIERADPTPIEVEYELARTQIGGPLPKRRMPLSPLVLAWLGLGAIGVIGVGLLAAQRLTVSPRVLPMAAVGLGGVALASTTATALADGVNPGFTVWGVVSVATWGAVVALARRQEDSGGGLLVAPAALLAAGGAWVGITAAGDESVGAWLRTIDQFAAGGAVVSLAYLAAGVRRVPGDPRWRPWVAGAGLVIGCGFGVWLAWSGAAAMAEAASWALLVAGAAAWPADVATFTDAGGPPIRRSVGDAGVGLADLLSGLQSETSDEVVVHVLAGIDESFVDIVLEDAGFGPRLTTSRAAEPLAGLLAMLALEGGLFPRQSGVHAGDGPADDPFADVGVRLGLLAAVPMGAHRDRAGLAVFAVATFEAGTAPPALDLPAFVDAVGTRESPAAVSEAIGIASEALLQTLRRRQRTTGVANVAAAPPATSEPVVERKPQPVGSADAAVASASDARWMGHLAEEVRRAYPVDDPDVLNDREWLALAFLRESIAPALIVGEPGVGKEFVARAVHHAMWADTRRFAVVDCSERPPSIVELDLFGDGESPGLLDAVGAGTVLLKGASAMGEARLTELVARAARSKARLVFAERYTGPEAGVPRTVPAAIREAVEDRNIHLSPLRDRPDDVVRYARYFLHRAAMRYDVTATGFSPDAERWLREQPLPGNLHELAAIVTAGVLRAGADRVGTSHLAGARAWDGEERAEALADLTEEEERERDAILTALARHDGNRTKAADALMMTRGSLLRRMRKYGID